MADGKPDLVQKVIGTEGGGHGWAFGDLNGDGRPDIAVSGKTGTWVLINEGKK